MRKLIVLSIALAAVLLATGSARAQTVKYCSNALTANAAYSQVSSTGSSSTVTYLLAIRNEDPARRTIAAMPMRLSRIGAFPATTLVLSPLELKGNEQKNVALYKITIPNPTGNGAPAAAEVSKLTNFICNFRTTP